MSNSNEFPWKKYPKSYITLEYLKALKIDSKTITSVAAALAAFWPW